MTKSAMIPHDIRQQAAHWLPVCPVHLIADRDTLILAPTEHLALSLAQANALALAFNEHFVADGYQLYVHGEQYWFLGSSHAFEVRLPPLPQAIGMNLRDAWQQGRDAKQWRKLLNEAQMLWFSHQVNLVREQVGALSLLSIYRNGAYNHAVGGARGSIHMQFRACDVRPLACPVERLHRAVLRVRDEAIFLGGVGRYPGFVHVDTRGVNADF